MSKETNFIIWCFSLVIAVVILGVVVNVAHGWEQNPIISPNTNITSTDLGDGFVARRGTFRGKTFYENHIDLGGGISVQRGTVGGHPYHCTTVDFGGGFTQMSCSQW